MFCCFFFNSTASTEIYTLSLHDALPIWLFDHDMNARLRSENGGFGVTRVWCTYENRTRVTPNPDRKSTRLNSSHGYISYAVFCLKKKIKVNMSVCLQSSRMR